MSDPRRVLVFAYYFPPLGLSGVQRIAKLVKYLPAVGWDPVVVTARPSTYFAYDYSLRSELDERGLEIHETGSVDPTRVRGSTTVAFPSEARRRAFSWLSSLIFIPDNKRGWKKRAVQQALALHHENPFEAVLATAPPYTALLAGKEFSEAVRVPLVCDFRDDWVENPRHVYPTRWHRRKHRELEATVAEASAAAIAINKYIAAALVDRNPVLADRIAIVSQGFDPEDFDDVIAEPKPISAARPPLSQAHRCSFLYAGTFYDAQRPDTFLAALAMVCKRRPDLRSRVVARFVGTFQPSLSDNIREMGLQDVAFVESYKEHTELCRLLVAADVLWMTIGRQPGEEQLSTGKLFEYFGTQKPILGLVPPGDAHEALSAYSAGFVCDPDDVTACAGVIERLVNLQSSHQLPVASPHEVSRYDRQTLAHRVAGILERVVATLVLLVVVLGLGLNNAAAQEIIVRVVPGGVSQQVLLQDSLVSPVSFDAPVGAGKRRSDKIAAFVVPLGDGQDLDTQVAWWASQPGVMYAHRNHRYKLDRGDLGAPDPLADSLAHHAVVNIAEAWRVTRGDPQIRVGFIDTGVQFDHPDLVGAFWVNSTEDRNGNGVLDADDLNGVDDDGNGWIDDVVGYDFVDRPQSVEPLDYRDRDPDPSDDGSGHGTLIAGVIGARAENGVGIVGLAPEIALVPLRGFGADGRGDDDDIAAALIYAADIGLDVVNLSFGDSYFSPLMDEAVRYATERGTVIVASAGNVGGDDPHYPSDYPEVLSTVWLVEDGSGPAGRASYGTGVDVGAPGSFVFTTQQAFMDQGVDAKLYGRQSGSSLAAPMVSATAALIRSVDRNLSPAAVRSAILGSATDIGEDGWDHRSGAGLLNAGAALRRALPARVQIIRPELNAGFEGPSITITGAVLHPELESFNVDFAGGSEDLLETDFVPVTSTQFSQVFNDTLATWRIDGLADGAYTIRLSARLSSGQTIEDRRVVYVDRSPPVVVQSDTYPAFHSGQPALFVDVETDDLATAELVASWSTGSSTRTISDRLARRHGLVLVAPVGAGSPTSVRIQLTNTAGRTTGVATDVEMPAAAVNDLLFRQELLALPDGFPLPVLTDFDRDGLKEIVFNDYSDGQLGDTVRVAEYPLWTTEGLIVSNVFPRDVGDTNADGRTELLGQVSGATILFEATAPSAVPSVVAWVDTTGLNKPTDPGAVWGAAIHDADGDGRGEVYAHNTSVFRVLKRDGGSFSEVAQLTNPTDVQSTELSENTLAQPDILIDDLDGDGATDFLFGDSDGDWVLWEATASESYALRWSFETDRYNAGRQFASGDARNGTRWFASSTTNWIGQRFDREYEPDATVVHVFGSTANDEYSELFSFAIPGEIDRHSSLGSIDANDDGFDELVVVAAPDLYVIDLSGSAPTLIYSLPRDGTRIRSAKSVVGDSNSDGVDELILATTSGAFARWTPTRPVPGAPARITRSIALDATSVLLEWDAPGTDSVTVFSRVPNGSLDIDTTVVGASTVTIGRTEPAEFVVQAWAAGVARPLSAPSFVRPHEPAFATDVSYPSDRQVSITFSDQIALIDNRTPVASLATSTIAISSVVVAGRRLTIGFDSPVADTLMLSGVTDREGTPVALTSTWIDTCEGGRQDDQLILSSWEVRPPNAVILRFSEPVVIGSATDADNYAVEPFGSVVSVSQIGDDGIEFILTLAGVGVGPTGLDARLRLLAVEAVSGRTTHGEGSVIALGGSAANLDQAFVFPNPAKPGHSAMTVGGVPNGTEVQIYSGGGVRVQTLREDDGNGGVTWDLRDFRGALVSSGVYLLHLLAPDGDQLTLKAAVIR